MSPSEAKDVMCGIFLDAWSGAGQNTSTVRWDDKAGTVPDAQVAWARVTIKHNDGPVRAFGAGGALYSNTGTLFIQVFTPVGDANQQAYDLAYAVVTAFRRSRNLGVAFRNPHLKEVGVSGAFEQTNVIADFSYDD